jgi:CDP-glycerol glycerophosphotransferase (TagB/SpsB family)
VIQRHGLYNFHGSHIIVHNELCKKSFIESSYCDEQRVSVAGALRMDKYLKTLSKKRGRINNRRKKFTLFYFPYNMSLFGKRGNPPKDCKYKYAYSIWSERKALFRDVHTVIVELAREHPEIDFIIKPKRIMMTNKSWLFYEQVLKEIGFNKNDVDNYSVEPSVDVHELILSSDVICALQSSTAIESAISGKPVILPVFDNYRKTENYKDFTWKNYTDIFDVANNKSHLKEMIMNLMNHPFVDDNVLIERKGVFKKFFNDLNGESLNKYVETITRVVKNSK